MFAMAATALAALRDDVDITPVTSPALAETGVEFVPMLVAAAAVLIIVGIAVVLVQVRQARLGRR